MFNRTKWLATYIPIMLFISYFVVFFEDIFYLKTNAENVVLANNQASALYLGIASVSIAMVGFIMVALPLIIDTFSSRINLVDMKEFQDKGGLTALLMYYSRIAVIFTILFTLSLVIVVGGFLTNIIAFGLTSALLAVSIWYLFVAIYGIHLIARIISKPNSLM